MNLIDCKPVTQTRIGYPEGNCLEACVASILHVPIEDVPELYRYGDEWYEVLTTYVRRKGLLMVYVPDAGIKPKGLHIVSGKSPRVETMYHACVARDGRIVHDPYPGLDGYPTPDALIRIRGYYLIIPLAV